MAASLRSAINAKCKECIYDPVGGKGTWRQQVEACTSRRCPLYEVRPVSEGGSGVDRGVAVENRAELTPEAA
jgi:hypothetical protein